MAAEIKFLYQPIDAKTVDINGMGTRGIALALVPTREAEVVDLIERSGENITGQPYVSREIARAGVLLHAARNRNNVSPSAVASTTFINGRSPRPDFIDGFENGNIPQPSLRQIITGAEKWIDPSDQSMHELIEIGETLEEENKWQWRLDHDNLPTGARIRVIRLSHGMSKQEFINRTGIAYRALQLVENGVEPTFRTLNLALRFNNFDKRFRRAAQHMRLDACLITPQIIEEFDQKSFGENIEYLRIQRGHSRGELGDIVKKSKELIAKIEGNGKVRSDSLDATFDGLEIPQEVRKYLVQKYQGTSQDLSSELHSLLLDTFYFNHDTLRITDQPFTQHDRTTYNLLKHKVEFGSALSHLRKYLGLKQFNLGAPRFIYDLEKGVEIPEDYVVAKIVMNMGFSMLDQTVFLLQQLAANGKVKHRRGNHRNFTKSKNRDERT